MSRFPSAAIPLVLVLVSAHPAPGAGVPPPILSDLRENLAAGLEEMNRGAEAAARGVELATGGEDEVRQILALVATHDPSVVDCGWIDSGGVLRWIEPAEWRGREGADLTGEEAVRAVRSSRRPALGAVIRGPEEIDASEIAYPVVASGGRLAGLVRMLFRPAPFLDRIVAARAAGSGWRVCVVQPDGMILYADDATLIGRSLTDGDFRSSPGLAETARRIQSEPDGAAATPGANPADPPSWEGYWTSVPFNGAAWRILVTRGDGGA